MATLNFTCQMLQGSLYAQLAQNTVASEGWRYTNRMAALGCAVFRTKIRRFKTDFRLTPPSRD